MTKNKSYYKTLDELRKIAGLDTADDKIEITSNITDPVTLRLVSELEVHKIELEMQNEDLRSAQAALVESGQKHEDSYNISPAGDLTFDINGKIVKANYTVAGILGTEPKSIVGSIFVKFVVNGDWDKYYRHITNIFRGKGALSCNLRLKGKAGSELCVRLYSKLTQDSKGNKTCRTVLFDESSFNVEQKKVEEKMIQTKEKICNTKIDDSKFFSKITHEFRTPLNAILGFAQLLMSDTETNLSLTHKSYLEYIVSSGWDLLEFSTVLTDLYRIDTGMMQMTFTQISIFDITNEIVQELESTSICKRDGIQIINKITGTDDVYVVADKAKLKQAFLCLMTNAIKHNIENGTVTISLQYNIEATLRINIRDTGPGIEQDKHDYIFLPFARLDNNEKKPPEGLGMGLTIAKKLAVLMDGNIGLESTVGVGSCFYIELKNER